MKHLRINFILVENMYHDLGITKFAYSSLTLGLRDPTQVSHMFETCCSQTRTVEEKQCLRLAYSHMISYMYLRPPTPPMDMPTSTIFNVNLLIHLCWMIVATLSFDHINPAKNTKKSTTHFLLLKCVMNGLFF